MSDLSLILSTLHYDYNLVTRMKLAVGLYRVRADVITLIEHRIPPSSLDNFEHYNTPDALWGGWGLATCTTS